MSEEKKVTQIRFEFDDETWEIIDHQNLKHIKEETKAKLDVALFNLVEELYEKRAESEKEEGGSDLGIEVKEDIKTKDVGPGQKG